MHKEDRSLEVAKLHRSFAAEVNGTDFKNISESTFKKLLAIIAEASRRSIR